MRRACLCAHAQKEGTGRGAACVRASCIALRASFRITCDGLRGGPLMQAVYTRPAMRAMGLCVAGP